MLRPLLCVTLTLTLPLLAQGWVDRTPANPLASPSARFDPAMCWDAAHGYVLMFGGVAFYGPVFPDDTWTWNGTAWTQQSPVTRPHANLGNGTMVAVAGRSSALAFHTPGNQPLLVCLGSTYLWTGSNWLAHSASIPSALSSSGMPTNVALGRDEARNQTVLFVGSHVQPNSGNPILQQGSETLLWDGFAWSLRPTATHPYPAEKPSLTFDPVAGKLLLCTTDASNSQSWFWDWNGSNWVQRAVAPSPGSGGALAGDPAHNRVVMLDASLAPAPGHTWTIAGGSGMRLSPSLEPSRRQCAGCTYDPVRQRTVVFGGINSPLIGPANFALADTWEFEFGLGAAFTAFGSGCPGSRGVTALAPQNNSLPRIGETFELRVGNLPFTGPAFLFFGLSDTSYGPTPLPFSLAGLGAPGCSVLCSGEELVVLTNVLGTAVWRRAIPNFPGLTFYNQAFAFDPAANALGLTTSNAGRGVVGF